MNVKDKAKQVSLMKAYDYLDKDFDTNLPKLLKAIKKLDPSGHAISRQINIVEKGIQDKDNNWNQFLHILWNDIDDNQRRMLFKGAIVNGSVIGTPIAEKYQEKYHCNVPWAILMDPTSACNLKCIGCWAAEYGHALNLTYEELDSIITQGEKMGTYVYILSGGEPLVRHKDVMKLCRNHPECAFLSFTNATFITDELADEIKEVGNFVPAISVEGFEEATDARRGKGTYQAVIAAMKRLKARKLMFGISCCYTSANTDVIGSDAFIDEMIKEGALFAWFFTYMPVGCINVPALIAKPEQRKHMYEFVRHIRQTRPLFALDFWNDGDYVGGCIAGGRAYLHINANGDVEPCAFIHYSDSNVKEKTLLEAYQSPLFMAYRRHQPFNKNMLRPCPVLDNPGELTRIVKESGAHSTDLLSPEPAKAFCDRCVDEAKLWADVADAIWADDPKKRGILLKGKMATKNPDYSSQYANQFHPIADKTKGDAEKLHDSKTK